MRPTGIDDADFDASRVPVEVTQNATPPDQDGKVLDAAQSRAGTISTKCTARVSPGSAPSTAMGPVTGFRKGNVHTWLGRSSTLRTLPANQSSVDSSTMVPGATVSSGFRPPNT